MNRVAWRRWVKRRKEGWIERGEYKGEGDRRWITKILRTRRSKKEARLKRE